jgi:hypothetical protein
VSKLSRFAVATTVAVACSGHVHAGGGAASAPVQIAMSAAPANPPAGGTVDVTVSVVVLQPISGLAYSLQPAPCAKVVSGVASAPIQPKPGVAQSFKVRVQVGSSAPCLLSAVVQSGASITHRIGSIQGLILNERKNEQTYTHGFSASGERTIEAPVGK